MGGWWTQSGLFVEEPRPYVFVDGAWRHFGSLDEAVAASTRSIAAMPFETLSPAVEAALMRATGASNAGGA